MKLLNHAIKKIDENFNIMKKIYIILLLLFVCMACKSEKEEISPLIGTT
jgi:hypothetical protein